MKNAIISAEGISILVCLVILYANVFELKQKGKRRRLFIGLTLTTMLSLISDMVSWILDGNVMFTVASVISTMLSMALSFAISGIFVLYVYEYISEKRKISFVPFHALFVLSMISMVLTVAFSFNGALFTFVDGVYVEGKYYVVYLIVNAISLLFGFVVICMSVKYLGLHDSIAAFSYIFIPLISMTISFFYSDFSMAYPAITISILIVHILMQSEHESLLLKQDQVKTEIITHDQLTGLLNRRAYTDSIDALKEKNQYVGVVFCDLNGLKYKNDHFGHESGDQMLCDFSEILRGTFRKDEVYRISGDEFVVILPGITEEMLDFRMSSLHKKIGEMEVPIASVGRSFGGTVKIEELIAEAEKMMYVEKENFYISFPMYRR